MLHICNLRRRGPDFCKRRMNSTSFIRNMCKVIRIINYTEIEAMLSFAARSAMFLLSLHNGIHQQEF
ncbi:hypothetical protein Y032_1163g3716 [Ancylostoma ceylanicum]|uniref:Uncharacterized protein n=1 Tax=Ancylostoma ceylanicum TaxID=53326 RepID=A0A016W628_9BILA|nr:hypothetical protein Y032_1163g3716 [Ancylostoma ceylanicum]